MKTCLRALLLLILILPAGNAAAQDWNFDARSIALGGGNSKNPAGGMVAADPQYRAIVLPFGLFQVLSDLNIFDPGSNKFDPVRSLEYAASPLHYQVGRNGTDTGVKFVTDVRNATLNRDLNAYRGFAPANTLFAEGLAAPTYGGTIKLSKSAGGFHGIYIGAGPYLYMRTSANIDSQLTAILGSATPVVVPRNAQFPLVDDSLGQAAFAVTGGYRGRFAWPSSIGSGSARDGLYVAMNYNYLRGFRYENTQLALRLDTDGAGLLTVNTNLPSPIIATRQYSSSGQGFALDASVAAVVARWEVGVGVNGIANRIDWSSVQQTRYTLGNLLSGNATFSSTGPVALPDARVELPVDYHGNVGYRADTWSAVAELGHGLGGNSFHSGFEERLGRIQLRGGARYASDMWNPTGGVGLDMSRRVSLDIGAFGTSANLERKRHLAIAFSIRINRLS